MLEKIALMDSQVIRALLVAVVGLAGVLASFFGVDEKLFSEKGQHLVDSISLVLTTGGIFYAAWARTSKANPPLTDQAVDHTRQLMQKQGGFARALLLGLVLAFSVPVFVFTVQGCATVQSLSFDQKLKLAIDTHAAVVDAVKVGVNSSQISADDAERFYHLALDARQLLDGAVALRGSDVKSAEGQLQLANDLLLRLQDYLTSKEKARG